MQGLYKLRKTMKNLHDDGQSHGSDFNLEFPEYKTGMLYQKNECHVMMPI
jgi:hypothetical protein